jgi:hypothetical protein
MKMTSIGAAAALAVCAVGVSAATAEAQPATATARPSVANVLLAPENSGVATTLASGRFTLSSDARTVTVSDRSGRPVETLPMAYRVDGRTVPLRAAIGQGGRELVLTPVDAPAVGASVGAAARRQFVDYNSDLARHQYNAGVGALIGAAVGGLIGIVFFGIGAIPGVLIGALIGAGVGWVSP